MNEEIIKKIAEEEFINNTMKHLDSALIFVYIKNLEKENAELRTDISARETICDDYKSRIDKAIEYIDKLWSFPGGNYEIAINERDSIDIDGNDYFDNLLNILQGSDKE